MSITHQIADDLLSVRETRPLVHNITNYVAMNFTANALLACGASPVMAHAKEEVGEMAQLASSLVLNPGTLSADWIESMLLAGRVARLKGTPIIFDPVGVGATTFRDRSAQEIMRVCQPHLIRGNASEIGALSGLDAQTRGVDASISTESVIEDALRLAKSSSSTVVVTGATDYILSANVKASIRNGHPLMSRVTAMGCASTAVLGAFAGVQKDFARAAISALTVMGIAGELAAEDCAGPGSFQLSFLDRLFSLTPEEVQECARVEVL